MLKTWLSEGFTKITGSEPSPDKSTCGISIYAAKSSSCSFQISFRSDADISGLTLETDTDPEGIVSELFRVHMLDVKGEEWPDPLSPFLGNLCLPAGKTRSLYIRFSVGAEAKPGEYRRVFTLNTAAGKTLETYTVNIRVWNFKLPDKPSMSTALILDRKSIELVYGYIKDYHDPLPAEYRDETDEIYKYYYDYLLRNRICPYILPYDILDDRADSYLDDKRVTTVYIPHKSDDDELKKIWYKLNRKPEWAAKAIIYPVDEPTSKEMLEEIREKTAHYRSICPGIRCATSFFCNIDYDENTDEIGFLADNLDVLCFKQKCWFDPAMYSPEQMKKYPPMKERTEELRRRGKTIWSYVCWEPRRPFANLLVDEPGIDHRILFWQQFDVGAEGFLYWDVNYWECLGGDPWSSMATVPWLSDDVIGDGCLLYNGEKHGVKGPLPSKRFECVREGIEDYELLCIAKSAMGEEWIDKYIRCVTQDIITYTQDERTFAAIRAEIGNKLEEKLNENN